MHEKYKLTETRYFLARMLAEHDGLTNFRFELSAFLGAGRSVLQYALEEAKLKRGGQQWYDNAMNDPLLAFFRDQRNASTHTAPVAPARDFRHYVSDYLRIDEDTIIPYRHHTSTHSYRFAAWQGDEDVVELSERYLNALQALVDDGVSQGMITG